MSQGSYKLGDVGYFGDSKICRLIWRMLAKLSYFVTKMFFNEELTCSHTLSKSYRIYFEEKIDFLPWILLYEPNLEISSLIRQGNQNPKYKGKT